MPLTRISPRRLVALALTLTAVMAGSGCGAFDMPAARPCTWLTGASDDAGGARNRTVVLVDRSSSTRPDKATAPTARVPDWPATLLAAPGLALPELEGGLLSVAGFDGTRATVDWQVDRVPVTP